MGMLTFFFCPSPSFIPMKENMKRGIVLEEGRGVKPFPQGWAEAQISP